MVEVASHALRKGRYVLGDLLGRGGMGEVYSGVAQGFHGFQKPVAIKRILDELAHDSTFVTRLIAEAKLLVGMQHGNIVSVIDLAREGEDVFLVMEFVDGPSLYQLLKARGGKRLAFGISTYVISAAAAGLHFAHTRPGGAIIHADISPGNLLLTTSGEVRVADFGIARREGANEGAIEGKWPYMAPEQVRAETITPRTDVFGLGVVLYELLTGEHPIPLNVTLAERLVGALEITPPRELNPQIPPGLDTLCMRMLAENPADRFASMQELSSSLSDERFANAWREGAVELAQAISEGAAKPIRKQVTTVQTGRPLTVLSRSLIPLPGTNDDLLDPTGVFAVDPQIVASLNEDDDVIAPPKPATKVAHRRTKSPSTELTSPYEGPETHGGTDTIEMPIPTIPPHERISALLAAPVPEGRMGSATQLVAPRPFSLAKPSRMRWWVAIVALVVVASIVAVLVSQRVESPPLQVASADATTPLDATTLALSPPDASEPDAPDVIETPVEPHPGSSAEPKPRPAKLGTKPPPQKQPKPPERKPEIGYLVVNTDDGSYAQIFITGDRADTPNASFKRPVGRYSIKIKDPQRGLERSCTIDLAAGQHALIVSLKTNKCTLR